MKKTKLPNVDEAIVTKVVIAQIKRRGKGTEDDPIRVITEVFSVDGKLIAEFDPYPYINPFL